MKLIKRTEPPASGNANEFVMYALHVTDDGNVLSWTPERRMAVVVSETLGTEVLKHSRYSGKLELVDASAD